MKLILFDFNGTLVDDNHAFWTAAVKVFQHHGAEPPSIEEYFLAMETHWLDVYRSKGIQGEPDELNKIYRPVFEALLTEAKAFPGTHEMLSELRERGYTLGIISAGITSTNAPALEQSGLKEFFDPQFIEFDNRSKRAAIEVFSEKAGISKRNCYYIGDAPSDIAESNKAGVHSIAFLPGFVPRHLVRAKSPTHEIHSMHELPAIVG